MLLLLLWLCLCCPLLAARPRRSRGRPYLPAPVLALCARKPDWVIEEVVRLRAHMPRDGCRAVALTFNRLHAARRAMTVSKSYVDRTVRARRYEIAEIRRRFKVRIPRPMPANHVWGLDLTGKRDLHGKDHSILGIVDHGTRFAVCLQALHNKTAITLLRALLDAIERHGCPASIRTDNEAIFTGWLFRFALAVLGIRHQRTELHCPWMNGRVERLFGTLKGKLDRWAVDGHDQLTLALGDFRAWYNHVRPHQHLQGRTPFEAWRELDPWSVPKAVRYFSAWDGMLTGYWIRR